MVRLLEAYGVVLTEHIGDPELTSLGETLTDLQIHDRDLQWLAQCDYLVAEVTTPSLGVGYELGKATEWGKQVLCLFRPSCGRRLSAMVAGTPLITLREYETTSQLPGIFNEFFGSD